MSRETAQLETYLDRLQELAFVTDVHLDLSRNTAGPQPDGCLRIQTGSKTYTLFFEHKRSHLTQAACASIVERARRDQDAQWILFAPYVGRPLGQLLEQNGIAYMDRVGNCFLKLGSAYVAKIEGRRETKDLVRKGRGLGKSGYQVIFSLLARPELLNQPVREIARLSGSSKSTVSKTLSDLTSEGVIGKGRTRRVLLEWKALLDRWVAGYIDTLRPSLLVGEFRTVDSEPERLEARLAETLGASRRQASTVKPDRREDFLWAFGGGAAAMKLNGFYRGPKTVVHTNSWNRVLTKKMGAIRSENGTLVVLGLPGLIAAQGLQEHTVHPLLVYTELLVSGGEREREAASRIREDFLQQ